MLLSYLFAFLIWRTISTNVRPLRKVAWAIFIIPCVIFLEVFVSSVFLYKVFIDRLWYLDIVRAVLLGPVLLTEQWAIKWVFYWSYFYATLLGDLVSAITGVTSSWILIFFRTRERYPVSSTLRKIAPTLTIAIMVFLLTCITSIFVSQQLFLSQFFPSLGFNRIIVLLLVGCFVALILLISCWGSKYWARLRINRFMAWVTLLFLLGGALASSLNIVERTRMPFYIHFVPVLSGLFLFLGFVALPFLVKKETNSNKLKVLFVFLLGLMFFYLGVAQYFVDVRSYGTALVYVGHICRIYSLPYIMCSLSYYCLASYNMFKTQKM